MVCAPRTLRELCFEQFIYSLNALSGYDIVFVSDPMKRNISISVERKELFHIMFLKGEISVFSDEDIVSAYSSIGFDGEPYLVS